MTDTPMSIGDARLASQARQFCGACEAGVEHSADECQATIGGVGMDHLTVVPTNFEPTHGGEAR